MTSSRLVNILARITAVFFFLIPFVSSSLTLSSYSFPKVAFFSLAIIGFLFVIAVFLFLRKESFKLPISRYSPFILIGFLILGIGTFFSSHIESALFGSPDVFEHGFLWMVLLGLFAYLVYGVLKENHLRWVFVGFVLGTGVSILWGLLGYLGLDLFPWRKVVSGEFYSSIGGPFDTASAAVIVLIFGVYLMTYGFFKKEKIFFGSGVFGSLASLVYLIGYQSIGLWVLVFLVLMFFVVIQVYTQRFSILNGLVFAVGLGTILLGSIFGRSIVFENSLQPTNLLDSTVEMHVAKKALEESPMFGVGLANYSEVFLSVDDEEMQNRDDWYVVYSMPSNTILLIASTLGYSGILAFAFFLIPLLYGVGLTLSRILHRNISLDGPELIGALMSLSLVVLLFFGIFHLTQFLLLFLGIGMMAKVMDAGENPYKGKISISSPKVFRLMAGVAVVFSFGLFVHIVLVGIREVHAGELRDELKPLNLDSGELNMARIGDLIDTFDDYNIQKSYYQYSSAFALSNVLDSISYDENTEALENQVLEAQKILSNVYYLLQNARANRPHNYAGELLLLNVYRSAIQKFGSTSIDGVAISDLSNSSLEILHEIAPLESEWRLVYGDIAMSYFDYDIAKMSYLEASSILPKLSALTDSSSLGILKGRMLDFRVRYIEASALSGDCEYALTEIEDLSPAFAEDSQMMVNFDALSDYCSAYPSESIDETLTLDDTASE